MSPFWREVTRKLKGPEVKESSKFLSFSAGSDERQVLRGQEGDVEAVKADVLPKQLGPGPQEQLGRGPQDPDRDEDRPKNILMTQAQSQGSSAAGVAHRADLPRLSSCLTSGMAGDAGRVAGHKVVAASRVGGQHRAYGFGREDSYAMTSTASDNCLVMAVADGVGSTRHAGIAAQASAVQGVMLIAQRIEAAGLTESEHHDDLWRAFSADTLKELSALINDEVVDSMADNWPYRALRPQFASKDLRPPATTLCLAAIWSGYPDTVIRWFKVGDSGLMLLRGGGFERLDELSEGRSKRTASLPRDFSEGAADTVTIASRAGATLVAATDGAIDLVDHDRERSETVIARSVSEMNVDRLSLFLGEEVEGLYDDRTILAVGLNR